ncbi:glycosyltransferase family 2 protein [Acuticoccus yangtzensis]|uniref:glycosyltransferase family 2 protein n=1 Tax=Acuticoccus yangtzensis TaxID=1443441 RepID=UPI0009494E73|nr:glycosyltransferase family 2 protein [Acuticoccus yangtzensis]
MTANGGRGPDDVLDAVPGGAFGEAFPEAPGEVVTIDDVLMRFGGEDTLLGIVDLVRRAPSPNAVAAIRRELARRIGAGKDGPTYRAFDALLGYQSGAVKVEALVEALSASVRADPSAYPPYNVLDYAGTRLPSVHTPAFRALMLEAAARNPELAVGAPVWAGPRERPAAFALLLGHAKADGLTPRVAMALLRLARLVSDGHFRTAFHHLWHMLPPASATSPVGAVSAEAAAHEDAPAGLVVEAMGLALLEAGQHEGDLAALLFAARDARHGTDAALTYACALIDTRCERLEAAARAFRRLTGDPVFGPRAATEASRIDLLLLERELAKASPRRQRTELAAMLQRVAAAGAPVPRSLAVHLADIALSAERLDVLALLKTMAERTEGGAEALAGAVAEEIHAGFGHPAIADEALPAGVATRVRLMAEALRRAGRGHAAFMLQSLLGAPDGAQDPIAALDFYFAAVGAGDLMGGRPGLAEVTRLYADRLKDAAWPQSTAGLPWPYYALTGLSDALPDRALPESALPDRALSESASGWPKISIIVPSFNQRQYVEETILSIVNQNYPNLEIIVFDAGSTDGTLDVFERYKSHFDVFVVEPDKGQSDAINKGMSRATGDLLYWLNTDDMLAPGALHAIGRTYAETGSDIIAGYCIETSNRMMRLLNLPQAEERDFTPEDITDLFGRWLKGDYFYQPEVMFTRSIWEKAGGKVRLDAHYAMDFEFWLRCTKLGATYTRVRAPIAFFRKHAEQKTDDLPDCIDEQAGLILENGFAETLPARTAAVRRLARRFATSGKRVAVVSKRYAKIFAANVHTELDTHETRYQVEFFDSPEAFDPRQVDLIINLCHVLGDYSDTLRYRHRGFAGPIVGWFWDNHHTYFENAHTARVLDFVCPSHVLFADYLRNRDAVSLDAVPLCVTQWTARNARTLYRRFGGGARDERLYGGFVRYNMGSKRNQLVLDLIGTDAPHALYLLDEMNLAPYFGKSAGERFADWCGYKTSLCLPLRNDLSQRFFDAWLTGQIPVVPRGLVPALEFLGADALERHVAVFEDYTPAAVHAAHAEALAKWNAAGQDGADARHALARDHHMFANRVSEIIDKVLAAAE